MMNQRLLGSACIAGLSLFATAGCGDDDTLVLSGTSLEVINQSDFALVEIRLTPVGNADLSDNLLRGDVLLPGESLLLGVNCDFYDALVVDEAGVDCQLFDLDLCVNDAQWVINNNTCTVFGAARREREEQQAAAAATTASLH